MIVYRSALIPRKLSCPSWLRAVLLTLILFWLLHHIVYWFYNSLQYTLFIFTNHFFLNPFMTEADMLRKSMDWFLYDIGLRHERVMTREAVSFEKVFHWTQWNQKKQFSWNLKVVLRPGYTVKYFFQSISCNIFWSLSWNKKILKTDFQNFLYRERLSYWICFHVWLSLFLSMTSAKI